MGGVRPLRRWQLLGRFGRAVGGSSVLVGPAWGTKWAPWASEPAPLHPGRVGDDERVMGSSGLACAHLQLIASRWSCSLGRPHGLGQPQTLDQANRNPSQYAAGHCQ